MNYASEWQGQTVFYRLTTPMGFIDYTEKRQVKIKLILERTRVQSSLCGEHMHPLPQLRMKKKIGQRLGHRLQYRLQIRYKCKVGSCRRDGSCKMSIKRR